jgi:hypothetical protein
MKLLNISQRTYFHASCVCVWGCLWCFEGKYGLMLACKNWIGCFKQVCSGLLVGIVLKILLGELSGSVCRYLGGGGRIWLLKRRES